LEWHDGARVGGDHMREVAALPWLAGCGNGIAGLLLVLRVQRKSIGDERLEGRLSTHVS
jgi:hypothetical protein